MFDVEKRKISIELAIEEDDEDDYDDVSDDTTGEVDFDDDIYDGNLLI